MTAPAETGPRRAIATALALTAALLSPGAARGDDPARTLGRNLPLAVTEAWTGDLDGMTARGFVRVLTAYSRTHFYLDGGEPRGLTQARMTALETFANERLPTPIEVVIVPAPRDLLLDWLLAGKGDLVAANLTVTPERADRVAFTMPLREDAAEQVVLAPGTPVPASLDALAAAAIPLHLRLESSYFQHVAALNAARDTPLAVTIVDPELTDEDLLDLVAAGLAPATVVDRHKLRLWQEVYPELVLPPGLVVADGREIAFAVRPDSVALRALLDAFVPGIAAGSRLGNILVDRYLGDPNRLSDPAAEAARARFAALRPAFEAAGARYGFDWTLLAAQGFQESRLDQAARGDRGAVGVMQILPSTAAEPYVALPGIDRAEVNIEAAAKYARWLVDTHFAAAGLPPREQALFALAAYNAGPGNIAEARRHAAARGLDPDRWFDHVELATAEVVSHQPVHYVRNILKYQVTYQRLLATASDG